MSKAVEMIFKGRVVAVRENPKGEALTRLFVRVTHVGDAADPKDLEGRFELKKPIVVMITLPGATAIDDIMAAVNKQDAARLYDGYRITSGKKGKGGSWVTFIAKGIHAWDGETVLRHSKTPVHRLAGFLPETVCLLVPDTWVRREGVSSDGLLTLEYTAPRLDLVAQGAAEAVQSAVEDAEEAVDLVGDTTEQATDNDPLVAELVSHLGISV